MADPVGLTASVIAIATLAYQSTKTLYELIDGIVKAPKQLKDLNEDLDAVKQLLASIKSAMEGTSDGKLSEGVKKCLEDVKPSMKGCEKACDEFAEKLSKITRHSSSDRTRFDDRLKLQFQEKEVLAFKYGIGSYKSTLSIALGLATLKSSDQNSDAVRRLETTIVDAIGSISGQIQGLEIGAQTVSDFAVQKDELLKALEDHNKALAQCLKVCTSALDETTHRTGNLTFKYARALDDARQLIVATVGNVNPGGGTVEAGTIIAQDRAHQMVAQSVAGDVALKFFASMEPRGGKGKDSSSLPMPEMPS